MATKQIRAEAYNGSRYNPLPIGRRMENETRTVVFESLAKFRELFKDNGSWSIVCQRPTEKAPYAATNVWESVEGYACWDVTDMDTGIEGFGQVELRYFPEILNENEDENTTEETKVYKSRVWTTKVTCSLAAVGEAPNLYSDWLTRVTAVQNEIKSNADAVLEMKEESESILQTFVTPDMYGAVGDGIHDDGPAIKAALMTGKLCIFTKDYYVFSTMIITKSCYLDGRGHTLYIDMGDNLYDENGNAAYETFMVYANVTQDTSAPLCRVRDLNPWYVADYIGIGVENNVQIDGGQQQYYWGYMSYMGRVPFPSQYIDKMKGEVRTYFEYIECDLRNFDMRLNHVMGRNGLKLMHCCNSTVYNVKVYCEDGNLSSGVSCDECYNVLFQKIYAENCFAKSTWDTRGNAGYGMHISGDGVTVRDYTGWDNKDEMCIAGSRSTWTTNFLLDGAFFGCHYDPTIFRPRSNHWTMERFADRFNSHEDAVCPIVTNVRILYEEATSGVEAFNFRCPEAIVSNITVMAPENSRLAISVGGINERIFLNNIDAPMAVISGGAGYNDSFRLTRWFYLTNSHIQRINNAVSCYNFVIDNCLIEEFIDSIQHLTMSNSVIFGKSKSAYAAMIPLSVKGDAMLTNCSIYYNRSEYYHKSVPLIKAQDDNSVWMTNCKLYLPLDCEVFLKDNEQEHVVNCWRQDVWGMILDDWEFGYLDNYNLQ